MQTHSRFSTLSLILFWFFAPDLPLRTFAEDPNAQPAVIAELVQQLGSLQFAEREAAMNQLRSIGAPSEPELIRAAREHRDPEVRQRANRLLLEVSDCSMHKWCSDIGV